MITVYTTVFGYTDPLHEPVRRWPGVRFVCFADQPVRARIWEVVRVPKVEAPTRMSRMMKALSHKYTDTEWALWIDANFTLLVDPRTLLKHGDFVTFRHRDRTRITDEAKEIIRLGKALPDKIEQQLSAYKADGFDTDENPMRELSCNGVILRRHTPEVIALNEALAHELSTHTLRDQMSLDYCAWKQGFTLKRWPGVHSSNPYFKYRSFRRPTNDF